MSEFTVEKNVKIAPASLPSRANLKDETLRQELPLKDEERLKIVKDLIKSSSDPDHRSSGAINFDKYTIAVVDLRESPSKEHSDEKQIGRYGISVATLSPNESMFSAGVSAEGKLIRKSVISDQPNKIVDISKSDATLVDSLLRKAAARSDASK